MNKAIISALPALLLATAAVNAQSAGQPQNPPPTQSATSVKPTTTLVGCLYREDQVPGRKPNAAERAGILEDYILADASVATGDAKTGTPGTAGTSGTSAAPASGNMYKIEGPSDDKLKPLVGKRVEVAGRIEPTGGRTDTHTPGARPNTGPGRDQIELPEFEASSIREVSGTCPANPALPK
jgi:hypothetical protein